MTTPTDPVTPKTPVTFEKWWAAEVANNERLRRTSDQIRMLTYRAALNGWNASAAASKQREEKLREYARHHSGCEATYCRCGYDDSWHLGPQEVSDEPRHDYAPRPCTCGLAALLGEGDGR